MEDFRAAAEKLSEMLRDVLATVRSNPVSFGHRFFNYCYNLFFRKNIDSIHIILLKLILLPLMICWDVLQLVSNTAHLLQQLNQFLLKLMQQAKCQIRNPWHLNQILLYLKQMTKTKFHQLCMKSNGIAPF